jgi:Tfp pilus assembly protein PilP
VKRRGVVLLVAGGLAAVGSAGPRWLAWAADPTAAAPVGLNAATGTPVKDLVSGALKDTAKGAAQGAAQLAGSLTGAGAAPAAAAAPLPADPEARAAMLRRKPLRDEDFLDDEDTNRDPFRSYLRLFADKQAVQVRKVPAIFDKFALEELSLIGIISGDANPRAMFRDPAGLGLTVKRGDYLSRAGARVTKILSDRVILELSETMPSGEARPLEKAVLVNPEENQK